MKNDFGGHDNFAHDNVYAFVGQGFGICGQLPGHADAFFNNHVPFILHRAPHATSGHSLYTQVIQNSDGNYANGACSGPAKTVVFNNSVYTPNGKVTECGTTLADWQSKGNDPLTTASTYPGDAVLLGLARTVLGMK